jgi:excisionase family DNA binding protein
LTRNNKFNAPIPGVFETIRAEAENLFEPLLTAEEAAQHLRIHVKTVQKLAREQRIPCVRMGKYWRLPLSSLDHWVTTQQNQSQPSTSSWVHQRTTSAPQTLIRPQLLLHSVQCHSSSFSIAD